MEDSLRGSEFCNGITLYVKNTYLKVLLHFIWCAQALILLKHIENFPLATLFMLSMIEYTFILSSVQAEKPV